MAIGARKAFEELPNESDQERWLKLPFTGCDGLPKTGEAWVRTGLLAATVFVPPNAGQAIEMIFDAIHRGKKAPERALNRPGLHPPSPRPETPLIPKCSSSVMSPFLVVAGLQTRRPPHPCGGSACCMVS